MLDSMTREEFDERYAADLLDDPLDRLATILKIGFSALCMEEVDPDVFDPPRVVKSKERVSRSGPVERDRGRGQSAEVACSPNQAAAMAAMCLGEPSAMPGRK